MQCTIRTASEDDFDAIWDIFHQVVLEGDTFIYPPQTTKEEAHNYWIHNANVYVAESDGVIHGTYVIRPNKIGLGSHVCNAGFMVDPKFQGQKVGRSMGLHALTEAKRIGYSAMQFNVVVSTNVKAVALWKSLGFNVIGTIPKGFMHKSKGMVDIYIMHRFL